MSGSTLYLLWNVSVAATETINKNFEVTCQIHRFSFMKTAGLHYDHFFIKISFITVNKYF